MKPRVSGDRDDVAGAIDPIPPAQEVAHVPPKLGSHRVGLSVSRDVRPRRPPAQLFKDLRAASIRATGHPRRVSPELRPRGTSAPQPPRPDGLGRLGASMALAILAHVDRTEAGQEGPSPRRVYRLTTRDSPGLGESCGRAISPGWWEASTGVEGPLGESSGLSPEADAVSGHGDLRPRTARTGSPPMPTRPERAWRATQAGRSPRRGRESSGPPPELPGLSPGLSSLPPLDASRLRVLGPLAPWELLRDAEDAHGQAEPSVPLAHSAPLRAARPAEVSR